MKTLKKLSILLVTSIVLISCKNSEKENSITKIVPKEDIASAESINSKENSKAIYLYVTAATGLSLREHANLQSEKLAIMPYGTRVKVIATEEKSTMEIGGINGGMDKIEFNHKKGFAFNGYLSKYFPPEKGISARGYSEELKEVFPNIKYKETKGGTVSKPSNTEILLLPDSNWHEAYYIAKELFNFPKEFEFPTKKGKENQIIKENKYKNDRWTSELEITRKENALIKITYKYKNKGFSKFITITKEGYGMNISKTEVVQ